MTWVLLLVVTMVTSAALWLVWMLVPAPEDLTTHRSLSPLEPGHPALQRLPRLPRRPGHGPWGDGLPAPRQGDQEDLAELDANSGPVRRGPMNRRAKDTDVSTLDPFETLQVQSRLTAIARNVRDLEGDPSAYARTTRLLACQLAYDALLAEACGLAGIDVDRNRPIDEDERFREEVELASRGWSW